MEHGTCNTLQAQPQFNHFTQYGRITLSRKTVISLVLAAILALLFWSELIFSSGASLGRIESTAASLGWTAGGTRIYFLLLALLDLVGGVSALAFLWAAVRRLTWLSTAVWALVGVTAVYALYQLVVAFLLPAELRFLYIGIGVVYGLISAGLWATRE